MLNNVFSHYVNKNFLFFPMHSFLLKQHYVRLLFCIIILSEKKSSQSTFMIKLLISRTIVPFRQIVISYFILYQLTANADNAMKASKGWDILCSQKSLLWYWQSFRNRKNKKNQRKANISLQAKLSLFAVSWKTCACVVA